MQGCVRELPAPRVIAVLSMAALLTSVGLVSTASAVPLKKLVVKPDVKRVVGTGGADLIRLEHGVKRALGRSGADRIYGHRGRDSIFGGPGNDRLYGGRGNDRLYGGGGSDTLFGQLGHDRLYGGPGKDFLYGAAGNDRLYGGRGNDRLYGSGGRDHLYGQAGHDLLDGGKGRDRLSGGDGNDRLHGAGDSDRLFGGRGNDALFADQGNDLVKGGAGSDLLAGGPGNDRLLGESGDDLIGAGSGVDRIYGGSGNDVIDAADGVRDVRIDGGPGIDTCYIDEADLGNVHSCENVKVVVPSDPDGFGSGGSPGSGDGADGGGGGSAGGPLAISSASGTACTVGLSCEFLLLGSGAKGSSLAVSVGGGSLGSGTGQVLAGGLWSATGSYVCLPASGDGKVTVSSAGETVTVTVRCKLPVGPGGEDNGKLTITSSSGLTCTAGQTCGYQLSGTGASGSVAVAGVPGVTAAGTGTVNADGTWSASGTYTCVAGGSLLVTDVADTAQAAVTCNLPGGGDPPAGSELTITSSSGLSCTVGQTCSFSLGGGGADGQTVAVVGVPGVVAAATGTASGGSWSAQGTYTCAAAGQLLVTDGADPADTVTASVSCSLL